MGERGQLSARDLERRLDACMLQDAAQLGVRLRRLRGRGGEAVEKIVRSIEESERRVEQRCLRLPRVEYAEELPVVARREEIAHAIAEHQVVVVAGETGSGKTTQIPKILLEMGRGVRGLIGHTQPRRIAARSVAMRLASELRTELGAAVGYKVRFGDRTSADGYVKIMTDGILLSETQGDRRLLQYDTIVIDEAHERTLNIDFLLGYLRQLLMKRADLKVVITSATIDHERFAAHFTDSEGRPAPVIEVSGRTYPVEVRYRPLETEDPDEADRTMEHAILDAVDELAREDRGRGGVGDVLVFLPGEREIRETAEALRKHHPPETEILPLFARLSVDEQMRVFQKHPGRRIVLATNVAETSLTVPGIRYVVDTGVARLNRYSARTRVQRLLVEPVSRASANQRAGRCGRVEPGVCIRLYSDASYAEREEFTPPEILRTNLASVILQMKALRLGDVTAFPFVEPPDHRLVRDGYETLHELGAVDEDGELTEIGVALAKLPVDPSIGRMILAAEKEGSIAEVMVIASGLSVQDPRERPMDRRDAADEAHSQWAHEGSDFLAMLNLWRWWHNLGKKLSGSQLRKACKQNFVSYMRMREWVDTHRQIRRLVTEMGHRENHSPCDETSVHRALLTGLLHTIGTLKPGEGAKGFDGHAYQGVRGTRFAIFPGSGLHGSKPKWVMSGELVRTTKLYARTVAKIDPRWIEDLAPHLVERKYSDPYWDGQSGRVLASMRVSLFGLEIAHRRGAHYGPADPVASRQIFIHHALVEGELQTKGGFHRHNRKLIERVRGMEAKVRRRDLLADSERLYAFFDARIPAEVYSASRFEKWRRDAERGQPKLLWLSEDDVIAGDASELTPERYPDRAEVGGRTSELGYRYDPGRPEDGVTLTVPVDALGRVDERRLEWLVPGLLEEKVEALIRALPKDLRRSLTPAPDVARRVVSELDVESLAAAGASFVDVVAERLGRIGGMQIPASLWVNAALPDHLRMRVRVLDEQGQELCSGRDVGVLREDLGVRVERALRSVEDPRWKITGERAWAWGDLPERVEVERDGRSVVGYPAVVDEGSTAGVRLLIDPDEAALSMRSGLRRLCVLELGSAVRHALEQDGRFAQLRLHAAAGGQSSGRVVDDVCALVAERACLGDAGGVRTREEFERALDRGWNRLAEVGGGVLEVVGGALQERQMMELLLIESVPASWVGTVQDIREQMGELFRPGWVLETAWRWLGQYARYVRAARLRFEKLRGGGQAAVARDEELARPVRACMHLWRVRSEEHAKRGVRDPELEMFRWMVEEYRVSVFAQELGTSVKVSQQRLEKQWSKVRG